MIHFNCTACNKSLKVKDELAGKKRICPHCQQPVTIPAMAVSPSGNEAVAEAPTLAPAARFLSQEAGQSGARQETVTYRPGAPQLQTIAADAVPAGCDPAHYDFLAPPEEPDELGRLGAYRVLKVLGAGGMGVVFLVEDATLKRKVALKAMLPTLAASESARQRFLREAQAAAAIEHDNIVAIFQVGEDRGVPFITMPFLKGEPLEARLQREPVLPIDEVIRIGRETARGLAAAHAADLMHRDIKPANLWLEGTEGRVKILDFGLARAGADDARLTQVGVIVGTPAYMAPEQANAQAIDVRCDLFSLGSVLYRLSTGNLPFKGPDTISTLMAVATVEPPPPRKLNPSLPQGLSDLILKLLSKKPGDRLPSAEAVIQALDDVEISLRPKGEGKANASVSPSPEGQEKGSEAEAHHQAYLAALEKPDWARALQELVKTIKLDAKRFAPFPTSKYSLQRILGKDDLGVTFLCKHKSMDAQVVVKGLISAEMGQQSDKVFAEAQALRQLDHPTILRMADCGYVDPATKSRPFLVMDHFNGATLEEHVQKNGPLPFADALAVARQVADGLHAAHDKKILHRSVNPSSLLIRKEGAAWRVKGYPAQIVAIPGNHDCQPDDPSDGVDPNKVPLDGWVRNFMSPDPTIIGSPSRDPHRTVMDLPNVYWTFTTPFATIIGLFSNVGETQGEIHQDQIDWFCGELQAADPGLALIVAVHHPPYSGDVEHGGSSEVEKVLFDKSFGVVKIYPDLILSGHAHNYQRFTKTVATTAGQRQIPCIVAGAGGYKTLRPIHPVNQLPLPLDNGLSLEGFDHSNFGFMRVEVSKSQILCTYLSDHYATHVAPAAKRVEQFRVDLNAHTVETIG